MWSGFTATDDLNEVTELSTGFLGIAGPIDVNIKFINIVSEIFSETFSMISMITSADLHNHFRRHSPHVFHGDRSGAACTKKANFNKTIKLSSRFIFSLSDETESEEARTRTTSVLNMRIARHLLTLSGIEAIKTQWLQ